MDDPAFNRIERTLAIRLPDVYRRSVGPFPIPREASNADSQVWDDADRLIDLNRRLRAEAEGCPAWLFAIGQAEGDPSGYAIDTRTPDGPVWWLDRMRLGPGSGPTGGPFDAWFTQWIADHAPEDPPDASGVRALAIWLAMSMALIVAAWAWAILT